MKMEGLNLIHKDSLKHQGHIVQSSEGFNYRCSCGHKGQVRDYIYQASEELENHYKSEK